MGLVLTQGLAIGGKEVPIYAYSYALAIDLAAGDANITLTNTDGSDYKVQWGDGEYTTQSSGVAATHTYASDYDGVVVIRSETPITALSSTDGDWVFNVASLPDSLTSLDFGFAGAVLTGAANELPSSIQTLDLGGSSSVLSGEIEDLPAGLTSIDINGTPSTITGYLSDLPSSLTYLDMSSTDITIYGDMANLPTTLVYFDLSDSASFVTAAAQTTTMGDGTRAVYLQDTNMASIEVDDVLAALATITTWVTEQAVNLGGNNASHSSAADDDITTLTGNGVTVTVNTDSPTYDDVTWIGEGTFQGASGAITVDFPTHASGDLLAFAVVCRHDDIPVTPAGWTEVVQDSSGTSNLTSIRLVVYYMLASGAGTTVTLSDFGAMHLSRGVALGSVDPSSPVNNYLVTVNSGAGLDSATTTHTFDGVVTNVPKAMVVTFVGFGEDGATTSGWACSNLASITQEVNDSTTSGNHCSSGVAQGIKTAAGDVGDTTVTTAVSVESVAIQVAFTPTSSGGVALPTTQATLTINQAVAPAEIIVTTGDASTYVVNWGDGTISAETASGVAASHTYASAYDGNVTLHSTGSVTEIEILSGGWDFPLTALPSTLTRLDCGGVAAVAITGTLAQLPSGMQYLLLWGTGSAITGNFGDEPSGLIDMHLFSSSSVIGGDIVNLTSTVIQDITLNSTSSDAAFDIANLPSTLKILRLNDSSCVVTASGPASITSLARVEIQDLSLSTAVVDAVLNALDDVTTWESPLILNIGGNNLGYTPATSSAAVTTLEALGVTVTANIIPDGGGAIERVGLIAQSYVANGEIYIGANNEDDWWREEYHDIEPYKSLAVTTGTGPSAGLHANAPSALEGTHWWSAYWGKDWPMRAGKFRTELLRPNNVQLAADTEYWIGIAWFIPDTADARFMAAQSYYNNHIFQFHYISPFNATSGMNLWNSRYKFKFGTKPEIDIGAIRFGVWEKIIIHTNMSTGSDGFVRAWLNPTVSGGEPVSDPVYEYTNQKISENTGLNPKIGVYILNGATGVVPAPPRDVRYYYDAYRIGNSNSNFISVYPGSV